MSASGNSQDWYKVQIWHRLSIDSPTDDTSLMESLLEQAMKDTQQLGKISLLIKQRLWLADTQRMQGNFSQAISLYELLIDLTGNSDFDFLFADDKIVWCVAKAFLGFVESKRLSSDVDVEQLLQKLDEGLNWLEKNEIDKPNWAAGLLLQKGLLLRAQGKLDDARLAMKDALVRKSRSQEAPGYPLATHQLEYADLLCNDVLGEYAEAITVAQRVLDTEGNSTYDRKWAYQILAYAQTKLARMGLGEPGAALEALKQAQSLEYTLESVDALTAMTQLLGRLPRQVENMVEDISKQTVHTINTYLTRPETKQVQPDAPQPIFPEQIALAHAELVNTIQDRLASIETFLDEMRQILSKRQEELASAVELKGIEDHFNAIQESLRESRDDIKHETSLLLNSIEDRLSDLQKTLVTNKQAAGLQPTQPQKHIVCLAVLPIGLNQTFDYKGVLLPALRRILEQETYYWEVTDANDKYYGDNIIDSMKNVHACIVDISDRDPDMFLELGRIHGARKDGCPLLIVLERGDHKSRLSIENDIIHILYPACQGAHAVEDLAEKLSKEFENGIIEKLDATKLHHYLSPSLLKEKAGAGDAVAKALSKTYKTMEAFVQAKDDDIGSSLRRRGFNTNTSLIQGHKIIVSDILKDLSP